MSQTATINTYDPATPDVTTRELASIDHIANADLVEKTCRRILQQTPEHAQALRLRGLVHLDTGDRQYGKRLLSRAVNADPQDMRVGLDYARALRVTGDHESARGILLQVLQNEPNWPEAEAHLGLIEHQLGHGENARTLLKKAIVSDPHHAEWHHWLSAALLQNGEHEDALHHAREAAQRSPYWADAWLNLGAAEWFLGKLPQAFESIKTAVSLRPDDDGARENIVRILVENGHTEKAEEFLQASLAERDSAQLHARLGILRITEKRYESALDPLLSAHERDPSNVTILASLGMAYSFLQLDEQAGKYLAQAVRRFPTDPLALMNYSVHMHYLGDTRRAERYALKALEQDPYRPDTLFTLVNLNGKNTPTDVQQRIDTVINHPHVRPNGVAKMHFARGDLRHAHKDYPGAFEDYSRGNALVREQLDYDRNYPQEVADFMKKSITPNELHRLRGAGSEDPTPVFIFGCPRSGTTLTEQIISAHENAGGVGERNDISLLWNDRHAYPSIADVGEAYVRSVRRSAGDDPARIVDKMPGNYAFVPFMHMALPQASLIHMRRHPLDTLLSCFRQHFAEPQSWSYDFADMAVYYAAYRDLIQRWREILPEGVMIEVDYEDIVTDFDSMARHLLDVTGLPWSDRVTDFQNNATGVRTASVNQVRQPLYRSSIGGWKRYQDHLKPLIEQLREQGVTLPDDVPAVVEV